MSRGTASQIPNDSGVVSSCASDEKGKTKRSLSFDGDPRPALRLNKIAAAEIKADLVQV